MSKKNLLLSQPRMSINRLQGYTLPVYHESKQTYIDYFACDPITGEFRRKKHMIPKHLPKREKRLYAAECIQRITAKLQTGWNPFAIENKDRLSIELEEAFKQYLDFYATGDRRKTYVTYRSYINAFRIFNERLTKPVKYLFQLDKYVLIQFLDNLITEGKSRRTRNNYRNWWYGFCDWLIGRGYLDANPVAKIEKLKNGEKNRAPLTPEMLDQLSDYLHETDPYMLLACMMQYYTLIRPNELSHLTVGDINAKEQTIYVSGRYSKNKKNQNVALNDSILSLMLDLRVLNQPRNFYIFGKGFRPSATRLKADSFTHRWAKIRKALGWDRCYQFYSLKENGIMDLANKHGIVMARDQARHGDVATTNKYLSGHATPVHEKVKHFRGRLG